MKGISIIICTYNGVSRLETTLEHLAHQNISEVPCEIILVDNASTDGTQEFADNWWKNNGNHTITYSSYQQPKPGKAYAQELAYEHAKYEYFLICDDDNWLNPEYIQVAFEIMEGNDQIGGLGGWCTAVFEGEEPAWFDKYSRYYAVSKQGKLSGDITDKKGCLYGAGMVMRKSHWLELNDKGFSPLLTCRKGDTLSSGGDTEYCYALRLLGYKIWYDDRLYFQHFMTSGRLNLDYLSRLRKAMMQSDFLLISYKDLIVRRLTSKYTFRKLALRNTLLRGLEMILKFCLGGKEAKENSKLFWWTQQQYWRGYSEYKSAVFSIKQWLK